MPDPAQPKLSASVILVDNDPDGRSPFVVYLLKRTEQSSFMPGRYVFPGGGLEPTDGDPETDGLTNCAIRELWEEAGVILGRPRDKTGPWPDQCHLEEQRRTLQGGGASLESAFAELGLEPDPEALRPYARWITPAARKKRFDAYFYVAKMPPGQTAQPDNLETTTGVWASPDQALAENDQGRSFLAPPQVRIMGELAEYDSLEALLRGAPQGKLEPVCPELVAGSGKRIIYLPWDEVLAGGVKPDLDSPGRQCEAGQATRLVHLDGRWLPYTCE